MYQPPISLIQKDVEFKIEDAVVKAIQKVGVEVDKEELLRALTYDRRQYEKGYGDGLIDAVKHGEWLPHPTEPDWDVCSVCRLGTRRRFHFNDGVYGGYDVEESFAYCPHCGAKLDGGESSICDNCDERSDAGCSWCKRMERSEE